MLFKIILSGLDFERASFKHKISLFRRLSNFYYKV